MPVVECSFRVSDHESVSEVSAIGIARKASHGGTVLSFEEILYIFCMAEGVPWATESTLMFPFPQPIAMRDPSLRNSKL